MLLITFCTLTLFLAGCGASHPPSGERHTQTAARLLLPATPTATSASGGQRGTYVGRAPNQHAWIGLSATGKQFTAFVTDGSPDHPPTFAQWFHGTLVNTTANASSPAKKGQDRLQALLTSTQAIGTITLASGTSIPFTANALAPANATPTSSPTPTPTPEAAATPTPEETPSPTPTSNPGAGLYRSERTTNGTRYVAGWIVMPASTTPGGPETPTPTATMQTPTATPVASVDQGAAIINEQTSAVQSAPMLSAQDVSAGTVLVPGLGTFNLLVCKPSLPC